MYNHFTSPYSMHPVDLTELYNVQITCTLFIFLIQFFTILLYKKMYTYYFETFFSHLGLKIKGGGPC